MLSAIERASGTAKTGTTALNSSSTPDPRHGTVQSSGGAITSTSPGSAGAGDPVKPKSVTAFHVPTSIVNSARVVSEDLDSESPPPTGPTHELSTMSVTPEPSALASRMVANTPEAPKPATEVSGLVSSVLAFAGLSPDAGKTPTEP